MALMVLLVKAAAASRWAKGGSDKFDVLVCYFYRKLQISGKLEEIRISLTAARSDGW